jgi:hypothetical protein
MSSHAEHGIPDIISFTRARNPVFWPKRGIKIGDSVLWSHVCVFVNPILQILYKIQSIKPHYSNASLANILQKNKATHRCNGLMCVFLSSQSCKYYTKYKATHRCHLMRRPRNPRFKDAHAGTKRSLKAKTINRDSGISGTASHWLADLVCESCVSFCQPILQRFYKRTKHQTPL